MTDSHTIKHKSFEDLSIQPTSTSPDAAQMADFHPTYLLQASRVRDGSRTVLQDKVQVEQTSRRTDGQTCATREDHSDDNNQRQYRLARKGIDGYKRQMFSVHAQRYLVRCRKRDGCALASQQLDHFQASAPQTSPCLFRALRNVEEQTWTQSSAFDQIVGRH